MGMGMKLVMGLAAIALVVPTGRADVVYSGPVSIPLSRDFTGTALNLITGEAAQDPYDDDLDLFVLDISGEWRFANLDTLEGGGIVVEEPGSLVAELLMAGDFIGPASPLREGGGIRTLGEFDDVSPAYVGLLFENESTNTMHYGWVELTLPSVGDGVVTSYAYNSEPNTGLIVPEPATLLLVGATVVALRRRD